MPAASMTYPGAPAPAAPPTCWPCSRRRASRVPSPSSTNTNGTCPRSRSASPSSARKRTNWRGYNVWISVGRVWNLPGRSGRSRTRPTSAFRVMLPDLQDTIVALSSAPGPGARAVVRLSGPRAFAVAGGVFTPAAALEPPRRGFHEGRAQLPGLHSPLPVDLYAWPGPRTYTGQDLVELHTLSCPPLLDL